MGNRVTRAARHLSEEEVSARMQREERPWRQQQWQVIAQALSAPRQAADIARTVGVSTSTVHRVIATYNREGVAALATPGKGGRRHQYLTLEQERTFLQPFVARAAQGEVATAAEIQHAFEELVGHSVDDSTLYRLLNRQGWSKPGTGLKVSAAPIPTPQSTPVQEPLVALRKRNQQQSPPKAQRKRLSPRYPSDLTDQEWAILEALIPQAKPGGHPRTVNMREVLNAILYVLRTGCQWRALPRDFAPWSTVWSYFRRWRISGEWERMHTALREQLRTSMGREATPSAAIIDSQSVKTTEKGGCAATMGAKR
ncbi:MAG: hypothetical protein NVSMB27_28960 [Ktedonobacteraceae bacterium]